MALRWERQGLARALLKGAASDLRRCGWRLLRRWACWAQRPRRRRKYSLQLQRAWGPERKPSGSQRNRLCPRSNRECRRLAPVSGLHVHAGRMRSCGGRAQGDGRCGGARRLIAWSAGYEREHRFETTATMQRANESVLCAWSGSRRDACGHATRRSAQMKALPRRQARE